MTNRVNMCDLIQCENCLYFIPLDEIAERDEYGNFPVKMGRDLGVDGLCSCSDKWTNRDSFCSDASFNGCKEYCVDFPKSLSILYKVKITAKDVLKWIDICCNECKAPEMLRYIGTYALNKARELEFSENDYSKKEK